MSKKPKAKPPSIEEAVSQYEARRPLLEQFTVELEGLLKGLLRRRGVDYSIVESRCKSVDSFKEKIGREGKAYADPLSEITDQVGIRIILYYTNDVDAVGKLIAEEFDVSASGDKRDTLKPNEFGYSSVHYVVSLSPARSTLAEWDTYAGLQAEIQVRTVLQHAWASISHAIDYKQEHDAPSQLRRPLFRLSALLELADEQFDTLRSKQRALLLETEQQIGKGELEIELNMDTVREFISSSDTVDAIVEASYRAGFEASTARDHTSDLVSQCRSFGISTIKELQDVLLTVQQVQDVFLQEVVRLYHKHILPHHWKGDRASFVLIVLLCAKKDSVAVATLMENGWRFKDGAEMVVAAFKSVEKE